MNTDIRISTSFLNHRKRKKLQQILGPGSTDYLIDLWINTAMNRPKGVLYDMEKVDIALDAGWDGKAEYFVDVLLQVGFLDYDGENFKLHDWDIHQAYAMHSEVRSERARKAASKRWGNDKQCGKDAGSIEQALPLVESSNAPSPTPSPIPTPSPKPKPTPKVKTNCPKKFPITTEMSEYASSKKYHKSLDDLTEGFLQYHKSKGTKMLCWFSAWQTWLRNDIKFYPDKTETDSTTMGAEETRKMMDSW